MNNDYGQEEISKYSDPKSWEIWPAPQKHAELLYQSYPEFTCLCPRSSYPDFATIHWLMIPDKKVVELKHLKLWLNSYRQKKISHELAAADILDTLVTTLHLRYFFIVMEYTPRGNLRTFPLLEYVSKDALHASIPEFELAYENAKLAKDALVRSLISRQIT